MFTFDKLKFYELWKTISSQEGKHKRNAPFLRQRGRHKIDAYKTHLSKPDMTRDFFLNNKDRYFPWPAMNCQNYVMIGFRQGMSRNYFLPAVVLYDNIRNHLQYSFTLYYQPR